MDAALIVIDNDAEPARARKLVGRLMASDNASNVARLEAQARLIAAYEKRKWPSRSPSTADIIHYLMDQHGLSRADMVPILGTASRVSEVLRGKKDSKHDHGAAFADAVSCAGGCAVAAAGQERETKSGVKIMPAPKVGLARLSY